MIYAQHSKGIMLLYVSFTIFFLAILFMLSPYVQIYGRKQTNEYFLLQARYLSESGINKAMAKLQQGKEEEFFEEQPEGSFRIHIKKLPEERWQIQSQSVLKNPHNFHFFIEALVAKKNKKFVILEWKERNR